METVQGIAEAILRARASATPVPADSVRVDAEVAYDVQDAVTASRLSAGERVVGWKLGYVSEVMREALGIQEPNAGPLTDAMVFTSPGHLTSGGLQPRVEPEIAVTLDADGAIAALWPAVEVVDSVWTDYRFDWAHNTADGSSASGAVLASSAVGTDWLADADVTLTSSSGVETTARVADQLPDLESAVDWLRSLLRSRGHELPGGSVILTGGLVAPTPLPAGGWVRARFSHPRSPHETIVVEAHRPGRNPT